MLEELTKRQSCWRWKASFCKIPISSLPDLAAMTGIFINFINLDLSEKQSFEIQTVSPIFICLALIVLSCGNGILADFLPLNGI